MKMWTEQIVGKIKFKTEKRGKKLPYGSSCFLIINVILPCSFSIELLLVFIFFLYPLSSRI